MHLPEAFLNRMKEDLGEGEFSEFLSSYEEKPVRSFRINTLKGEKAEGILGEYKGEFGLRRVPWCESGYYYDGDSRPGKHPLHEAGAWYIQEASAMAPALWLDVKPGQRVLDLCAAPGGKSTEIASLMGNRGFLLSNEIVGERSGILSQNIERMGIINAMVSKETPDRLSALFPGYFDRVLVDAPCSGEGMFRKEPEAVNEWKEGTNSFCASRQRDILTEAVKLLSPGGIMVYSTCTFSREENEERVEELLRENEDMEILDPESLRGIPKEFSITEIQTGDPSRPGKAVRIFPHRAPGEGHFFAVLRKTGDINSNIVRVSGTGSLKDAGREKTGFVKEFLSQWTKDLKLPEGIIHSFGDQLYLALPEMPGINGLKVLRCGLHLGTLKNKRFVPSHSLALFLKPEEALIDIPVSTEEAEKFIRGESLIPEGDIGRGWCILSFKSLSLGWGKSDGRIIKNHYPKGLRRQLSD